MWVDDVKGEAKSYTEQLESINTHPIIQKRGKLFRNWWNYRSIFGIASALKCPECGSSAENLGWKCHGLTIPEATELAHKMYVEAVNDEEDNKTLDKFKEEIERSGDE